MALCDEMFDRFPLFDLTLRHIELCNIAPYQSHTVQLNPPTLFYNSEEGYKAKTINLLTTKHLFALLMKNIRNFFLSKTQIVTKNTLYVDYTLYTHCSLFSVHVLQ